MSDKLSINDIKNEYKTIHDYDIVLFENFINKYKLDERAGVISLVKKAKIKIHDYELEVERSKNMLKFEKKYKEMGYKHICGIDEVGRGPLAGPVVTCAVILPSDEIILGLNDSKQLSKKKREELYDIIVNKAICYSIGINSHERIDEINILQATYEAMRMSIYNMDVKPDLLLNDAVRIPDVDITQVPIIKGDTLSASIAAASIVAKVTRDRIMEDYDKKYPGYDFKNNVGYGSGKHIEAIKNLGPCEIHRRTFIKNFI